ncbi:MAG: acyl-CoA thioesterase [Hyphomicrobiaceae bacterium]
MTNKTFETKRELRFGDCDISGTAYFPSYLDLLNGVNEEFWASIGFPWHDIIPKERWGTPTVHISCDFFKPSLFGDVLSFELTVVKVGRSSVTIHHTIRCGDEIRWTSTQVLVASDLETHTSIPWPQKLRANLASFLSDDAHHNT